jgi:hypothetical protein
MKSYIFLPLLFPVLEVANAGDRGFLRDTLFSSAEDSTRKLQLEGWLLPSYPIRRFTPFDTLDAATQEEVTTILDCKSESASVIRS